TPGDADVAVGKREQVILVTPAVAAPPTPAPTPPPVFVARTQVAPRPVTQKPAGSEQLEIRAFRQGDQTLLQAGIVRTAALKGKEDSFKKLAAGPWKVEATDGQVRLGCSLFEATANRVVKDAEQILLEGKVRMTVRGKSGEAPTEVAAE